MSRANGPDRRPQPSLSGRLRYALAHVNARCFRGGEVIAPPTGDAQRPQQAAAETAPRSAATASPGEEGERAATARDSEQSYARRDGSPAFIHARTRNGHAHARVGIRAQWVQSAAHEGCNWRNRHCRKLALGCLLSCPPVAHRPADPHGKRDRIPTMQLGLRRSSCPSFHHAGLRATAYYPRRRGRPSSTARAESGSGPSSPRLPPRTPF
jgi:hypothetical protein